MQVAPFNGLIQWLLNKESFWQSKVSSKEAFNVQIRIQKLGYFYPLGRHNEKVGKNYYWYYSLIIMNQAQTLVMIQKSALLFYTWDKSCQSCSPKTLADNH